MIFPTIFPSYENIVTTFKVPFRKRHVETWFGVVRKEFGRHMDQETDEEDLKFMIVHLFEQTCWVHFRDDQEELKAEMIEHLEALIDRYLDERTT